MDDEKLLIDGTILGGTVNVKLIDFSPTLLPPLYVIHFNLPLPDVAFGILYAKSIDGVHVTDELDVLSTILPLAFPKYQYIVCVKEDEAFEIEIVIGDPIVLPLALMLDALGICGKDTEYPYLVLVTAYQ